MIRLVNLCILYAMHLNDNSLFCVRINLGRIYTEYSDACVNLNPVESIPANVSSTCKYNEWGNNYLSQYSTVYSCSKLLQCRIVWYRWQLQKHSEVMGFNQPVDIHSIALTLPSYLTISYLTLPLVEDEGLDLQIW
jgi:hypothetical protein